MSKKSSRTTEIRVAACSEEPSVVVGSFFNGMLVPEKSNFDLFQHKHKKDSYFLHGENSTLEYNGYTGEDENNDYIVALYDPAHKSVELYKAPMVYGKVTSIDSRVHKGPKVKSRGLHNFVQRTALGEAFGTKKAKAAIVNLEKNRIDADKLQDMELDIVDNVKELTLDLPTRQQLQDAGSVDRPVPPVNENATNVEDVYALHSIIPKKEWASIRINSIFDEETEEKRLEMLPYSKSAFVAKNLAKFVPLHNESKVQMLFYASLLFGVYANRRVRNKNALMERLGNKPSEVLVDGILERFAVSRTSDFGKTKDRSFIIDPYHEDKLLCYLLALLFHIEGFTLEILPLANELNMKPTRLVTLLRTMGAIIKPIGVGMAEAIGLSKKEAATYKVAVLKVPFKLPEMVRRGARR
ncbi:CIC11C00000004964 [Sungouiella intermedia]|uniref:CIC11C00000004964 n=1 Tax=Sungouiella intermedia TaxID=45354 RepID=A0A1L0DXJ5_9ASCO|nr:CIC11C00000004964 [[Candida] intermedia]